MGVIILAEEHTVSGQEKEALNSEMKRLVQHTLYPCAVHLWKPTFLNIDMSLQANLFNLSEAQFPQPQQLKNNNKIRNSEYMREKQPIMAVRGLILKMQK